jgi:phage shock protein PspC (stress-responsive transcriptional regulator)
MGDKKIAGVCGGLARQLGLDSGKVRWAFVLLVLFAGLSAWVYLVAWFLMPSDGGSDAYRPD